MERSLGLSVEEEKQLMILKNHFNNVFIAGGLLRDCALGIPFKDIDVFIFCKDDGINLTKKTIQEGLGWWPTEGFYITSEEYENDEGHIKLTLQNRNNRLNIVFIDIPPEEYIRNHFDHPACQIWWDLKKEELGTTEAFDLFINERVVAVTKTNWENPHFKRVNDKFRYYNINYKYMMTTEEEWKKLVS